MAGEASVAAKKDGVYLPGRSWNPARGRLYRFSSSGVTVIQPWPRPLAWERFQTHRWIGSWPSVELRLADPAFAARTSPGLRRESPAWETVPEPVRRRVLRSSLAGRQWASLRAAATCPQLVGLEEEVPLLAGLLANVNLLRRSSGRSSLAHPWRAIEAQGRRALGWAGWREAAGWLGLPSDRSFVRILRSTGPLEPETWELWSAWGLGSAWADPHGRKLLQHLPRLGPGHATLLRVAQEVALLKQISPALLEQASDLQILGPVCRLLWELGELAEASGRRDRLPPFRSLAQLEELRAELLLAQARRFEGMPFPPPPLAGDEFVQPITSDVALVAEGLEMNHCLGRSSWRQLARIRSGYAYTVRVPDPEGGPQPHRGTLWIVPVRGRVGRFAVEQLQGPGNRNPGPLVRGRVESWLTRHAACLAWREGSAPEPELVLPPPEPTWAEAHQRGANVHLWGLAPVGDAPGWDDIPF